jgi:hypothetical protein
MLPLSELDVAGGVAVGSYAGVTAAPTNGLIVSGNVGIGTTVPQALLQVGSTSASGVVAEFQNSSGACTFTPGASSMTPSCSSDIRLKTDVRDAGNALAWLGDMRVRDFTVKANGERRTGVIAQEMLRTHPELVRMGRDGFYAVEEPNPWKLVKALQELKADNDNLRAANDNETAQIKKLTARLDALEAARR